MRFLLSILALCALIWLLAFGWFLQHVPAAMPGKTLAKADAIVVLTGGSLRVEHGLWRFGEDAAPLLLISGVGADTKLSELLHTHAPEAFIRGLQAKKQSIYLDRIANSTYTNAQQTAKFARAHGVKRIRLVTANYHMPRSLLEMRLALPDVVFIPDAVVPRNFVQAGWWKKRETRTLLLTEFHKIWAVRLRNLLETAPVETRL